MSKIFNLKIMVTYKLNGEAISGAEVIKLRKSKKLSGTLEINDDVRNFTSIREYNKGYCRQLKTYSNEEKTYDFHKSTKTETSIITFSYEGELLYCSKSIKGKQEGFFFSRWSDGEPKREGFYKNGKKVGLWIEYWTAKKLKSKVFYHDDGSVTELPLK